MYVYHALPLKSLLFTVILFFMYTLIYPNVFMYIMSIVNLFMNYLVIILSGDTFNI